MNVSVGARWEEFLETIVKEGRYGSVSEVVREGLRLVEEREAKLRDLKATIQASIAEGGSYTSEEVMDYVRQRMEERKRPANAAE